ncbi:MAG: nucleotidyl transferase AbiEii/AbiGii toxin family protein [Nitrospirae bacterium]|nr:nucleotidyl transferase AbiEii/AbiGii toxin family protein [Nitrospirota bacterium]
MSKYQGILAGGTAIALHLGHRISVDLDFFTNTEFRTDDIIASIRRSGLPFQVSAEGEAYLIANIYGVKVSLFYYDYPFIDAIQFKKISIASVLDIAAMKIIAIGQRGKKRDFVDLYFILQSVPFHKIAEHMVRRFGKERISPQHIGKALVYFTDADYDPDPEYIGEAIPWDTVRKFFRQQAKQLTLTIFNALQPIAAEG